MKKLKLVFVIPWQKCALFLVAIIFLACNGKDKKICWGDSIRIFPKIDSNPAWSPDGMWIAYNHLDSLTYLIQQDGTNIILWHDRGVKPVWSPNGEWIIFSDYGQIWKKGIDGNCLTQLTLEEGNNSSPRWSHDGKKISYRRRISNNIDEMWILDLDNNTEYKRYSGFSFNNYVWIDNENILLESTCYVENTTGSKFSLLNIETQAFYTIANIPKMFGSHSFDYSNINFKILFTSYTLDAETNCSSCDIWIMNEDCSYQSKLIELAHSAAWSPDGTQIAYTSAQWENGYLWIMDLADGSKRQLTFENHYCTLQTEKYNTTEKLLIVK